MVLLSSAPDCSEIAPSRKESADGYGSESASAGKEACRGSETSGGASVDGDVPMPWWYTPKRLLVRLSCNHPYLVYSLKPRLEN